MRSCRRFYATVRTRGRSSAPVCLSVLVLWRDSMAMTMATLIKVLTGTCLQVQRLSPLSLWQETWCTQADRIADSSIFRPVDRRKRKPLSLAWTFEDLKAHPQWHILQQGYSNTNTTTPPNPFNIVALHGDQAFKCVSLWRPFLFKLLHSESLWNALKTLWELGGKIRSGDTLDNVLVPVRTWARP